MCDLDRYTIEIMPVDSPSNSFTTFSFCCIVIISRILMNNVITIGKIDPDVSTATTEKLRSNMSKIVSPNKDAHDDDDLGSSNDGYGTSEVPETTTTQTADSPMIVHFSGKKYRADEFITPRTKLAFSYGAKDEEIADLHRELEQANRRAAMAQQEQR